MADEERLQGEELAEKAPGAIVVTAADVEAQPPPSQQRVTGGVAKLPGVAAIPGQRDVTLFPAGFWLRFVAKMIDLLVVFVPFGFATGIVFLLDHFGLVNVPWEALQTNALLVVASLASAYVSCYAVYSISAHAAHGKTIGKCVCGICVVLPDDRCSRGWYFIGRFIVASSGLLLFAIGHIMAGVRRDKRALHDLVVGSRVVKYPRGA